MGQEIGTGKIKVQWPGLNAPLFQDRKLTPISVVGEDKDRDTRLQELRGKMDKFRRISIPAHERGWSGGTLNGKSIGVPAENHDVDFSNFDTRILEYKVVTNVTSVMGKKRTPKCLVVTGNKNGVIGFGIGRAPIVAGAMRLAKHQSTKRLMKIDLFENRTLFHDFYQEYYYTKIYAERKPAGYGIKAHRVIKTICELLGLKDIRVKVDGSMNTNNMAKAFVDGLLKQNKYNQIANKNGLHVVEIKPEMHYYPHILASPNNPVTKLESQSEYENDLTLHILQNRYRMAPKKLTPFYNDYPHYKQYLMRTKRNKALKETKVARLVSLQDDVITTAQYPRKPPPKETPAEEAS